MKPILSVLTFAIILVALLPAKASLENELKEYFVGDGDLISSAPQLCSSLNTAIESTWCKTGPSCEPDSIAKSYLVPFRQDGVINTTYVKIPGLGHQFTSTGFVLVPSQGGPGISRGLIFIPEDHVEGGAYAPLASLTARVGYYVIILESITGLTDDEVILQVERAYALNPTFSFWAIGGHGRGGNIAALIASRDRARKFKGLVLYGAAPLAHNFTNLNLAISVGYARNDTIVPPSDVELFLATRVPPDAWSLAFANTQHMDFAYSTCLNNSFAPGSGACTPIRFRDPGLPVFSMPPANSGSKVQVNPMNAITQDGFASGALEVLGEKCSEDGSEFSLDGGLTWHVDVSDDNTLNDYLYVTGHGPAPLRLEARTSRSNYSNVVAALTGAKIRTHFDCPRIDKSGCVEFYLHPNPANFTLPLSRAASLQGTGNSNPGSNGLMSVILGVVHWAAATPRALSFMNNALLTRSGTPRNDTKVYPQVNIDNQLGDVEAGQMQVVGFTGPVPRVWYYWKPVNTSAVRAGLVYFPGGAVDARAYAPLAFQLAARGVVVVIPTVPARAALFDFFLTPTLIRTNPAFSYVGSTRWAVGGHSLGGFAAYSYVSISANSTFSAMQALVMHGGAIVPPGTGAFPLKVANIYGNLDGLISMKAIPPALSNPANTFSIEILGANHFQTGDYGYQFPDNIAVISQEQQQERFAEETVNVLAAAGL